MRNIALYTGLWFLAGYAVTRLFRVWFGVPIEPYQGGLVGLLIGLVILIPFIQTERGRRLFYEGPAEGEEGDPIIGCLFYLPVFVLIITLIAWVGGIVWPIG